MSRLCLHGCAIIIYMSKNLVIVESPAKAQTIEKYLGADFQVLASVGHIRKDTKVDKSTFDVTYEIDPGHTKIIADIKKAVKEENKKEKKLEKAEAKAEKAAAKAAKKQNK